MKNKLFVLAFLMITILVGCNFPGSQNTNGLPTEDSMATEIAKILTGTPIPIILSPTSQQGQTTPIITATNTTEITEAATPTATTTMTFTMVPEDLTPTPTETQEPSPTPTLSDEDPALTLGDADWSDNMETDEEWPTGINEYTSINFEDGFLKLTAEKEVDGWRLSWPYLDNFYLEAKMQSPACAGTDHYGLMFRVPANANANKGYLFGITCDGQYSLRRWDGQTMHTPISWTEDEAINTGADASNTIGVWADGATLAFYINGVKVNEISDNAYLEGSFGIFVGSDVTEDLTVWIDQIRYWSLP